MELKRLGADYETDHNLEWFHPREPKPPRNDGKKVAIIGAGPAGLTAAYYLGLEGIQVDIFEELPVLGGEVAVGVPQYRMPIEKYNKDIELVTSLPTVTVYANHKVDAKRLKEIDAQYDATLLAFGTRLSKQVRAKNEREEMVIMLYRRDEKTIIRNTTYEEYHEAVEEGVEFILTLMVGVRNLLKLRVEILKLSVIF